VLRPNTYHGWKGRTSARSTAERLLRAVPRAAAAGTRRFDERFFYHYEEVDLCYRVRKAGYSILHAPDVVITHLGGQSVGRFPIRFELEKYRNRYRYFHKHFGRHGLLNCRRVSLLHLGVRLLGYGAWGLLNRTDEQKNRWRCCGGDAWNWQLDRSGSSGTARSPTAAMSR